MTEAAEFVLVIIREAAAGSFGKFLAGRRLFQVPEGAEYEEKLPCCGSKEYYFLQEFLMKKLILGVLLLACVALTGVMAQDAAAASPDYFTFGVGAMPYYDLATEAIDVMIPFGVQFYFNDMFSAGFSFADFGTNDIAFVNIGVMPADNVKAAFYVGDMDGDLGFGLGVGYDFFTKKETFFSSMGLYIDWLASNAAKDTLGSIRNGGVLSMGLKTSFGI